MKWNLLYPRWGIYEQVPCLLNMLDLEVICGVSLGSSTQEKLGCLPVILVSVLIALLWTLAFKKTDFLKIEK